MFGGHSFGASILLARANTLYFSSFAKAGLRDSDGVAPRDGARTVGFLDVLPPPWVWRCGCVRGLYGLPGAVRWRVVSGLLPVYRCFLGWGCGVWSHGVLFVGVCGAALAICYGVPGFVRGGWVFFVLFVVVNYVHWGAIVWFCSWAWGSGRYVGLGRCSRSRVHGVTLLNRNNSNGAALTSTVLFCNGTARHVNGVDSDAAIVSFSTRRGGHGASMSASYCTLRVTSDGLGVVSTPNLFSFTTNMDRTLSTTSATVVAVSNGSNLAINTGRYFRGTHTLGGNITIFINGLSSDRTRFCHMLSTLTNRCNTIVYPIVIPCVRNRRIGYCVGLVRGGTCTTGNLRLGRVHVPMDDRVSGVEDVLLRTITATSRSLVRGCFTNRRFAPSRVVGNLTINIGSNSVYPICDNIRRDNGTIPLVISDLLGVTPTTYSYACATTSNGRITFDGSNSTTVAMFGAVTSPFINGLSCFGILSNRVGDSAHLVGDHANGRRHLSGIVCLGTNGRRSTGAVVTNSVNTITGLNGILANSALSTGKGVGTGGPSFPLPGLAITICPGTGNSRSGVTATLAHVARRSPAIGICGSGRARRLVLYTLNRRRVSIVVSHLGTGFNTSVVLGTPGVTCHRAVHGRIGIRKHRGGRSNNRNRFNSI